MSFGRTLSAPPLIAFVALSRDPSAAARFDAHFEHMWDAAQPMDEFEPAIKALEPK